MINIRLIRIPEYYSDGVRKSDYGWQSWAGVPRVGDTIDFTEDGEMPLNPKGEVVSVTWLRPCNVHVTVKEPIRYHQ